MSAPAGDPWAAAFRSRARTGADFGPGRRLYAGLETRTDPQTYRWDGAARLDATSGTRVLYQQTLGGSGLFEAHGRAWDVGPGRAFLALLPSPHVYGLPATSASWRFVWWICDHPFVVQRVRGILRRSEPVFDAPADGPAAARGLALFRGVCQGTLADDLALEEEAVAWAFALERQRRDAADPDGLRGRWLRTVRGWVEERPERPPDVAAIAARFGMGRSQFSHRFRAVTGATPAAFMLGVRLDQAVERLRHTRDTLEHIARDLGFADAVHLSKCFRRRFGQPPGAFRRAWR